MRSIRSDEKQMRSKQEHALQLGICLAILISGLPSSAAVDPATTTTPYQGHPVDPLDQWQRIEFRSEGFRVRTAPSIKLAVQTRGPAMQGLIRIPGAPASNFNTGKGLTVVDLINVGNEAKGYAEIVALEIVFTQRAPEQHYRVFVVDNADERSLTDGRD